MRLFESFIIAFSMYSKIPMPKMNWEKANMKYAICFFPLIGIVIGGLQWLFSMAANALHFGDFLYAVIAVLIPVIVTGGIHLDGMFDTFDALSSYQPREKKLEILSDPHTGAFAVIGGICYFLFMVGLWTDMPLEYIGFIIVGYVLSRALSGLAVVTFKNAKKSGLVNTFSEASHKDNVKRTMLFYILSCFLLFLWLNPLVGSVCILGALLVFWHYYHMSKKEFGGITGDLAGYFLQVCELTILFLCVVCSKIMI